MYGFENDYDFYPATESNAITEFFSNVWNKIKEFGAKIKEWAGKIKEKIKYLLMTKKEKIEYNDKMLADKVKAVDDDVNELLNKCNGYINELSNAFGEVAKDNSEGSDVESYKDTKDNMSTTEKTEWNRAQTKIISGLNEDVKIVKRVKDNLTEIKHVGMATKGALEQAYRDLTEMYSANGKCGNSWAKVMKFQEACTGQMKTLLGKIVSVYDAIKGAATALMNKLIGGKFVDTADSKMTAKELKAYRKSGNEYHVGKKDFKKEANNNDVRQHEDYKNLKGGLKGMRQLDEDEHTSLRDKLGADYQEESVADIFNFDFDDGNQMSDVTESAAYEIGYEQAIQDMAVFNAIPDASAEFDW